MGIGSKGKSLSAHWSPRKLMPLPLVSVRMSSRRFLPETGELWIKPMPDKTAAPMLLGGVRAHPVLTGISKRAM